MSVAAGIANIVLGAVYCQYGTMTIYDMRRNWSKLGFSHFGAAWIAMAFTCGPHHLVHGIHLLGASTRPGPLDLAVVLVGFPAGVTWFLLRVEAMTGRAGDRFIRGDPLPIIALPTIAAVYLASLISVGASSGTFSTRQLPAVTPNLMLVPIYVTIGYYLLRTQLANRRPLGGWSLSGLALAVIFPTCAVMHGVYAYSALNGHYGAATHTTVIDWFAVPAGLYFLWVVRALYSGAFMDWNQSPLRRSSGAEGGPGPHGGATGAPHAAALATWAVVALAGAGWFSFAHTPAAGAQTAAASDAHGGWLCRLF